MQPAAARPLTADEAMAAIHARYGQPPEETQDATQTD